MISWTRGTENGASIAAAGTSTVFLKNVKKNRPEVVTIYGRIPPGRTSPGDPIPTP